MQFNFVLSSYIISLQMPHPNFNLDSELLLRHIYNEQHDHFRRNYKSGKKVFCIKMSATLRVQEFTSGRVFQTLPLVIDVPEQMSRYSVFCKENRENRFVRAAYKKILAIHKRPLGGIFFFT